MQQRARHPSGFIAPCLPTRAATAPLGTGWLHEIKHDGATSERLDMTPYLH